jgi:cellulose synthase/poly-beta-1,6-N-acetylglucosamine synthase-like glycosyltransferase
VSVLQDGLSYLAGQSEVSLVELFWYTLLFEIPRYGLPVLALAAGFALVRGDGAGHQPAGIDPRRVSVVVPGHNEAGSLEACVRSLRQQSIQGFEIVVVSDGSSDAMLAVASDLMRRGLVDQVLGCDLRNGKSAGLNLGSRVARGDLLVHIDCDCSYDRYALEEILAPLADPAVGAVCGDIVPRNGDQSLTARFQEIEYLQTISVGKRIAAAVDQVVCVSGAFGAFRRAALDGAGGFDVGGGEDLDATLRLRAAGWSIAFAPQAVCYTDVPVAPWPLIRQRLRWDRDAIRLRYRKNRRLMWPGCVGFEWREALQQWDFLLFNVISALVFPLYLGWLFQAYGGFALVILLAMQGGLVALDAAMLALAGEITGRPVVLRHLPYVVGYSIFTSYVMRFVRLTAYLGEWLLFASEHDDYVPAKVRARRLW